jgi:hypothetical protein
VDLDIFDEAHGTEHAVVSSLLLSSLVFFKSLILFHTFLVASTTCLPKVCPAMAKCQ